MDIAWFNNTFQLLNSKKVTDQRQGFCKLSEAININCRFHLVINFLNRNEHHTYTWNYVFLTLHELFVSEVLRKNVQKVPRFNIQILTDILREANEDELRISIQELVSAILEILDSAELYQHYGENYLRILITNVLKDSRYCRDINTNNWKQLFVCIKRLCEKSLENFTSNLLINALALIIEYGPKCGLPDIILRDEFPLITKICSTLKPNQSKVIIESILNLNLQFTSLLANDCRVSCCKFGEDTAETLLKLSKTTTIDDNIRNIIYKIFLLQMKIHHPRGCSEGEVAFYAVSLTKWSFAIKCLYYDVCYEIKTKMMRKLPAYGAKTSSIPQILCSEITKLATEIFKQVFPMEGNDLTQMNLTGIEEDREESVERPTKLQRREIGIAYILTKAERKFGWPWVNVLKEYLEKYPMISVHDFNSILRVLSKLQLECDDLDMRFHLYRCLTVLVNAEMQLNLHSADSNDVKDLWLRVWDSSVRACGLNHNEEETHKLLQVLLRHKKNINPPSLFRTYLSTPSVINLSEHSLHTLNIACSIYTLPETVSSNDTSKRLGLIKWILATDCEKAANYEVFSLPIVAHVLVALQLKTWPAFESHPKPFSAEAETDDSNFSAIESLCMDTIYENPLLIGNPPKKMQQVQRTYIVYPGLQEKLSRLLESSMESTGLDNNLSAALNYTILVTNILSKMVEFRIVASPEELSELKVCALLKRLLELDTELLQVYVLKADATKYLELLESFFSIVFPPEYWDLVQMWIPLDLLKFIFQMLNLESLPDKENKETKQKEKHCNFYVKIAAMRAISRYCCVPITTEFSGFQLKALNALSEVDFDAKDDFFYQSELIFLSTLEYLKVGSLPQNILRNMINLLGQLCEVYYKDFNVVCRILQVLYNLYPHVNASDEESIRTDSMAILHIIIQHYHDSPSLFGQDALVRLVNCLGQLAKLDPDLRWAKFENGDVAVFQLPIFLKNDSQKVRLCAVSNLVHVFASGTLIETQKKIFERTCFEIIDMFTVNGHENLGKERQVDEVITRTASALHIYSTIMCANSVWRQRALFAMLQFVVERKLNVDSTKKMLNKVGQYLKFDDGISFLNTNVYYIISRWHMTKYSLETFPFALFGCESDLQFYVTNFKIVIPIIFRENKMELLERVCQNLGLPMKEVMESAYPKIVATYLPSLSSDSSSGTNSDEADCTSLSPDERRRNLKMYEQFQKILSSERVQELLVPHMDEVIFYLLQLVCDCDHFKHKFGISYMLTESDQPVLNVKDCIQTLKNIETQLPNQQNLIAYLFSENVTKLQNLLILLTSAIHNTVIVDEKVKYLHHYTIFIDYITEKLRKPNQMQQYVVKHIVMSLLHLVSRDSESFTTLNIIACKYLKMFLQDVHSECTAVLENLLCVIVNTVVPIAKRESQLARECVSLLDSLVLSASNLMKDTVKRLDPFPGDDKFAMVQSVYETLRYRDGKRVSLEEEIEHFLAAGKLMGNEQSRVDGLKFLCEQLSAKKEELGRMYGKLKKMKGYSEDCAESSLHKLISMLVKLSSSTDENVRIEAARCLGELGPADLTTLVLHTESLNLSHSNAIDFLLGKSISLLSDYLVDPDIEVMTTASAALHTILSNKDGRQTLSGDQEYDSKTIDKDFLFPFLARKATAKADYNINKQNFKEVLDDELWLACGSHRDWVVLLACKILNCFTDKSALKSLIPVCKAKVEFAEKVLPLVLMFLLNLRIKLISKPILEKVNAFFERHWHLSNSDLDSDLVSSFSSVTLINSKETVLNKSSIQIMLNVVHLMRMYSITIENASPNYLHVAHAAQFCAAHFTSAMYAELWCEERLTELMEQKKEDFVFLFENYTSKLNYICKKDKAKIVRSLQAILREGYGRIGDEDAILGCGYSYLMEPNMRTEYNKHIYRTFFHSNTKVNSNRNQIFTTRNREDHGDLWPDLRQSSLYFQSFNDENASLSLETLRRLSEWDFSAHYLDKNLTLTPYERNNLLALKAIHDNDDRGFDESIFQARKNVLESLGRIGLETASGLYGVLMRLQSLVEVEEFRAAKKNGASAQIKNILDKWNHEKSRIPCNDFTNLEPIIAQRIVLLEDCIIGGYENLKGSLLQMQLDLACLARLEGHEDTAKRIVMNLVQMKDLDPKLCSRIVFEEAQLIWKDNSKFACEILENLMLTLERSNNDPSLNFDVHMLYGKWMYQRKSMNVQVIIKKYFNVAMAIWDGSEGRSAKFDEQMFDAHHVLGNYMDSEYRLITDHIKSSFFENKIANMEKSIGIAAQLKREIKGQEGDPATKHKRRAIMVHENQSAIDKEEIDQKHKERSQYLGYALNYYLRNLQNSDKNNLNVFRVFSLWLENKNSTDVSAVMEEKLKDLPTFKLIPVLPQVIPHVGSEERHFALQINSVLEKCAQEHPHHTLPLILALKYSYKDREHDPSLQVEEPPNEPRVQAANALMSSLKKSAALAPIIKNMELLWDALIELAYHENQTNSITNKLKIMKVRDFDNIALPTLEIPVHKSGNYQQLIGVQSFARSYSIPNGVNRPKKICCTGTDGVSRLQLVKGNDDLHQDAVMQQVFSIMNMFLSKNKHTERLNVRTYKVVPLSQRCGILQWCENTSVISEYLVGSGSGSKSQGAHQRYHPMDAPPNRCRQEILNASKKPKSEKLNCYLNICRKFRPVFHNYFIEMFPQPTVWYERRRAYTNSVATSSMVGYILGLGDRHLTNILIDNSTAEVIHIDFGIAFEQGLLLRTPEMVPFRLTRDIEDGMGVSGIEGNFSRACERTMHVMRENALTIVTILEVLLYDPLYAWTITPAQAYSKQRNTDDLDEIRMNMSNSDLVEKNSTAERALARLRQKLHCSEKERDSVSVEAEVKGLIETARDPRNLSQMFHGWQAYL